MMVLQICTALILVLVALHLDATDADLVQICGASGRLDVGEDYIFTSPNYPNPYPGFSRCDWTVATPDNTIVNLDCHYFDVHIGPAGCNGSDVFLFSPSGDLKSGDEEIFCGKSKINRNTTTNSFDAYFYTSKGFRCVIRVLEDTVTTKSGASSTMYVSINTPAEISAPSGSKSSCKCGNNSQYRPNIVGGLEPPQHQWPWDVSLYSHNDGHAFCSGSLISPSWVLTAGWCIKKYEMDQMFVRIGLHGTNTGSYTDHIKHHIRQKIAHTGNDYRGALHPDDIAVIQLSSPVEYSQWISPVCLSTNLCTQMFDGENATANGWRFKTSYTPSLSSGPLQVTIRVISNTECARLWGSIYIIQDDHVCTDGASKGVCYGGNGAPLLWLDDTGHYQQIGLSLRQMRCENGKVPGIFTRITSYIDWIEKNTNITFCSP